jgi:hypothetical protein
MQSPTIPSSSNKEAPVQETGTNASQTKSEVAYLQYSSLEKLL